MNILFETFSVEESSKCRSGPFQGFDRAVSLITNPKTSRPVLFRSLANKMCSTCKK